MMSLCNTLLEMSAHELIFRY